MTEIAYFIDKIESEKGNCLAIRLVEAEKNGYLYSFKESRTPITASKWQQLATDKDKDSLRIPSLKGVKLESPYLKIPYSESIQALKWLAASGKVYFNQKQLVCDFFSKVDFYYLIENKIVSGRLKTTNQEFALTDCDFISAGSKLWFIKGQVLKLIQTEVSWSDLKKLYYNPEKFKVEDLLDEEEIPVVYKDNSLEEIKQTQKPIPFLILKDKTGAFADLWMNYGSGKSIAFHDPVKTQRDLVTENSWEKDLLETDFIRKQVGQTHYFCPLDKVNKSLTFLLEIGWKIQDHQGCEVVLNKELDLQVSMKEHQILVQGRLKYDSYEANLKDVAGAFNRRERFVQIGPTTVGLLPEQWGKHDLNTIFEEAEIVSDGLKLGRQQIGILEGFSNSSRKDHLDESLEKLRQGLSSLTDMPIVKLENNFRGTLRPYQQQGVNWLSFLTHYGFNGILADDMGLGKTVQVIAFLSQLKMTHPLLIVMPTSLIFNWKREFERFLPNKNVIIHHGPLRNKNANFSENSIILTSYSTLRIDLSLFSNTNFSGIILDEAQAIKNSQTQAAQAVFQLQSDFRLLLTGTPVENHLGELWSHFHFLMPELLGDEKSFYADLQAGASDMRYITKIKKKVKPFILRRKKSEVAKDLPDCIEQTVWVEMPISQREVYESYLSGIRNNLFKKANVEGLSKNRLELFEAILRLRQICCHPLLISSQLSENSTYESGKMETLLQDIENAVEENDKVLVYSQFTSMLSLIAKEVQKRGWKYVTLDGTTKNREEVVNQFQNESDIHLFLISLKAGGTGLNLTAADHVMIFDPWWNEAAEKQAINRAHRIGRQSTVFAKRYVTIETIEEKMMKLKEQKRLIIDNLFDDEATFAQLTLEDFEYLLQ